MSCKGVDPHCPCHDGDACHYEPFGMTPPFPVRDVIP